MTTEIKTSQSNVRAQIVKRMFMILPLGVLCLTSLALFVPGPIQKSTYTGSQYCGSCHVEEYKSWVTSPHARATDMLADGDKTRLACLSCHATGVQETSQSFFKGVGCEACHGPGGHYASLHVKKDPVLSKLLFMQKPDEQSCLACHSQTANLWSPHHAMKKIDHWSKVDVPFHGSDVRRTN